MGAWITTKHYLSWDPTLGWFLIPVPPQGRQAYHAALLLSLSWRNISKLGRSMIDLCSIDHWIVSLTRQGAAPPGVCTWSCLWGLWSPRTLHWSRCCRLQTSAGPPGKSWRPPRRELRPEETILGTIKWSQDTYFNYPYYTVSHCFISSNTLMD